MRVLRRYRIDQKFDPPPPVSNITMNAINKCNAFLSFIYL